MKKKIVVLITQSPPSDALFQRYVHDLFESYTYRDIIFVELLRCLECYKCTITFIFPSLTFRRLKCQSCTVYEVTALKMLRRPIKPVSSMSWGDTSFTERRSASPECPRPCARVKVEVEIDSQIWVSSRKH